MTLEKSRIAWQAPQRRNSGPLFRQTLDATGLSFEAAVAHLGGLPVIVGPDELQLGRGETIEDTARIVSGYARAFVIRTYGDDEVRRSAMAATIPVINALTDRHHPCQSLADVMTLRERFGRLRGVKLAYVGDGNTNVASSLIEAAGLVGIDMAIASPCGYAPDPSVVDWASTHGGRVSLTDDPVSAVHQANAVYTESGSRWAIPRENGLRECKILLPTAFRPNSWHVHGLMRCSCIVCRHIAARKLTRP